MEVTSWHKAGGNQNCAEGPGAGKIWARPWFCVAVGQRIVVRIAGPSKETIFTWSPRENGGCVFGRAGEMTGGRIGPAWPLRWSVAQGSRFPPWPSSHLYVHGVVCRLARPRRGFQRTSGTPVPSTVAATWLYKLLKQEGSFVGIRGRFTCDCHRNLSNLRLTGRFAPRRQAAQPADDSAFCGSLEDRPTAGPSPCPTREVCFFWRPLALSREP